MEEVDKIIIITIKGLDCDLEDDVVSVKHLSSCIFIEAVVKMVRIIDPTFEKSHILPNSMSVRYKYCAELSDKIKSLGFQGDIGYQTFLYGNEIEIRRTLMYLIERLPREQIIVTTQHETKLDCFKKKLLTAIGDTSSTTKSTKFLSLPLETGIVKPGQMKNSMSPREWREHCIKHLKFITHQIDKDYILPSIITLNAYDSVEKDIPYPIIELEKADSNVEKSESVRNFIPRDILQSDLNKMSQDLQSEIEELAKLKLEYKQILKLKEEAEDKLNKNKRDTDMNEKINIMLEEADEFTEKLETKINGAHNKMKQLQEQWESMCKPLLEEKNKKSRKQNNTSQYYEQLKHLTETATALKKEYENKTKSFNELNENLPKKSSNRSSFTKRILEIINNIKKQDSDITKIIGDTKHVQKELNNVNGKIERCFTLADEMIFRDTSRDEMSRRAYKYLVTLHTDCSDIVKIVTDTGNLKKEMKNLEDHIDNLCNKNIHENLLQIQKDIQHMKTESNSLQQQIQSISMP